MEHSGKCRLTHDLRAVPQKKVLDTHYKLCYNEYTTEEGKPLKTRKAIIMKKSTLKSLVSYLTEKNDPSMQDILTELTTELERGKEKADANRKVYAEMHNAVMEVLKSASLPVSAQEIADETGLARGKIVYGLTNYWADEVEKIPGKTNTYKVKGE